MGVVVVAAVVASFVVVVYPGKAKHNDQDIFQSKPKGIAPLSIHLSVSLQSV